MTDELINQNVPPLLARAVATVAGELNIASRNWSAYPPGHPVIETSLQKLLIAILNLLQLQSPVQIGITRDGLLLGADFAEKGNAVCRIIATALFERGAGTLLFRQAPGRDELQTLLRVMNMKREHIQAEGGIEKIFETSGVTSLELRGIRYDRFSGTEEAVITADSEDSGAAGSGNVWGRFVRIMMQGELGLSSMDDNGEFRPEVLAAALNARFAQRMGTGSGLSSNTIRNSIELMRELLGEKNTPAIGTDNQQASSGSTESPRQTGLHAFIAALDPALRRQILDGFCETGDAADDSAAEMLVRQLGPAMMQDTYAKAEEYSAAPPLLQGILRKLLPHMVSTYETATPQDEIRDKVRTLLQEHNQEAYIPDEYLLGLKDLLADNPLPQIEKNALRELLSSVEPAAIEIRSSEIIMQLVITDPDGEDAQELILNLTDLCCNFLELGDYGQVLLILRQAADPALAPRLRSALREAFSQPEFLNEILSGLTVWGRPKYDQVTQLIRVIGAPFINPLIDQLATEENMSLRRFLVDRVLAFGDAARPELLARLSDQRWYVLRNIIAMLRTLAPGQESDRLRHLLKHPNQKVHQEVIKSLLLAGDPSAHRQLLRDLDSGNREIKLAAIFLADKTSSLDMARKLADMLLVGGFSADEYEIKAACVKALAEIGKTEIIPELGKILKMRSLLAFRTLNRLKADIVRSLERYPATAVLPVLEHLAAGKDEVASLAAESLKNVRRSRES